MNEKLNWKAPDGFKLEASWGTGWSSVRGDNAYEYLYLKEDETIDNWTEKILSRELVIAMTNFSSMSWKPESVMNSVRSNYENIPCTIDEWNVLEQDETSILFETEITNCKDHEDEFQITRILLGRWNGWAIQYGIKGKELADLERNQIINNLMGASIRVVK